MIYEEREVVARITTLNLRDLRAWVRAGLVAPQRGEQGPVFDDEDIARLWLICDLRKDMAIEPDAVEVILSLVDQVNGLRRDLALLTAAVADQPKETRQSVAAAFAARRHEG